MPFSTRFVLWAFAVVLQACADVRPVPSPPASDAATAVVRPVANTDTAQTAAAPVGGGNTPSADGGSAPDAGQPAPTAAKLVDLGLDERGRVQPCDAATHYMPLASVFARRPLGTVKVRGRLWLPAGALCTAGEPPFCTGYLVFADARPTDGTRRLISLIGNLAPGTTLTCDGPPGHLRCPIPAEGQEYGASGTLLTGEWGFERWTLDTDSLCRMGPSGKP